MSTQPTHPRHALTEPLYRFLRDIPWWIVIVTIVGLIVAYAVLTSVYYLDALYFIFDLPWNKELIAEVPVEGEIWCYAPDAKLPLDPGVYRVYAEFSEVRASAKVESPLYAEADAESEQVGQLGEGDLVQFLRWKIVPKEGLTPEQRWVYVQRGDGWTGWALDKQFGVEVYRSVTESPTYTLEVPKDAEPVAADPIESPPGELLQVGTSTPTVCGPVIAGSSVRVWNRYNLGQTIVRAWTAKGVMLTLRATLFGFALALVLGLIAGLMLVSNNAILLAIAKLYVEVVRGIPLLVIILYVGFVVTPYLREATDGRIDLRGFSGAIIGLGFGYGAYLAEVFRAGIQSIHHGQMEAARSLGMSYLQAMRHVVLPQAFRVVLPPLGNDFIAMLKDSSLISVVALAEILQQGRLWVSRTFRAFEGYNTVGLMYLVMTLLLSLLVRFVERNTALPGRSEE